MWIPSNSYDNGDLVCDVVLQLYFFQNVSPDFRLKGIKTTCSSNWTNCVILQKLSFREFLVFSSSRNQSIEYFFRCKLTSSIN